MIIKMAEWAGMELLAIALVRFFMMVSGRDNISVWERSVAEERKAFHILGISTDDN